MIAAPILAVVLIPAFAVLAPSLVVFAATLTGMVAAHPPRRLRQVATAMSRSPVFMVGVIGSHDLSVKRNRNFEQWFPYPLGIRNEMAVDDLWL